MLGIPLNFHMKQIESPARTMRGYKQQEGNKLFSLVFSLSCSSSGQPPKDNSCENSNEPLPLPSERILPTGDRER